MKKCPTCRQPGMAKTEPEEYRYSECGLDDVYLHGVTIYECSACGETLTSIAKIERLHRVIAEQLARQGGSLTAAHVVFLRKYLGYSNRDFARRMGVAPETSSRWASGQLQMSGSAEALLRLLALLGERVEEYPIPEAATGGEATSGGLHLQHTATTWRPAA